MNNDPGIRNGLIAGVAIVFYFLLFYFISPKLFFGVWTQWGALVIYLAFMTKACWDKRKVLEEDFDFQQALKTAFVVYVVAAFIYALFNFLLLTYIDPELLEVQRQVLLERLEVSQALMNAEELESMKRTIADQDLSIDFQSAMLSFGLSLIGGFILSLIVAAFTRNN